MTAKDTTQAPTRVFLHSAPRTSSTWFWSRFRALPETLCYWEPFNEWLGTVSEAHVGSFAYDAWDSRHTPTDPNFREYLPLLQPGGGIAGYDPAMSYAWFIPEGGLRGELRQKEKDYLSLLIGHAENEAKVPVLGGWRTLGRAWAMREAFGGFHVFQYRNLWRHWLSILSFKRRNDTLFYGNHIDTICRDDDEFLRHLARRARALAADPATGHDAKAPPRPWRRPYALPARDENLARELELLPEPQAFTLFMGLHIYLYLHAQLAADLEADVSRMARDEAYRAGIERKILEKTGLAVSFEGVREIGRTSDAEFDAAAIDWNEVRGHAAAAAAMLRAYGDEKTLQANAAALVEATMQEMREGQEKAVPARVPPVPGTRRIGLCMIVKNEAPVIRRCLDSVRPLIDYVLIEDTGSTDGTQDIIRAWLAEASVPGEVVEEPWRDFAHNRSLALARLREHPDIDYALIIDADDTLQVPRDFRKPDLDADCYVIEIEDRGVRYQRTQIVRNDQPWRYRGVLHEFLECGETHTTGHLPVVMRRNYDGARRRDSETYRKDAAILERALQTETDAFLVARYTFYLAQSYRDSGEREKAIETYLFRATLGYWQQEVFVALLNAARLKDELGHDRDEVLALYLRASDAVPTRAEGLHGAARLCRIAGRNKEGYDIAKRGLGLKPPADGLFVEPWIYDFGLPDEFAVNAYWAGAYRESLDACLRILELPILGPELRKRILDNAKFAAEKLPRGPNLGSRGEEGFAAQHALTAPRALRSRVDGAPRVLLAILAKQKEASLPLYLECIEALDYPRSSIVLYIRTNNNTDRTEQILREWVARVGHLYAGVEFDAEDVADRVEKFGVHEWNATRFRVLGRIRNISLRKALDYDCDFYFVADVDNFIRPCTLRELVALDLPIVAPFLRSIGPLDPYSNCHAEVDANGYYQECDQYYWIVNRWIRGIVELPLVHCTYLVRADVLKDVTYEDGTDRHEYVVFADSARKAGVSQYFDNRQVYGYVTFDKGDGHYVEGGIARAGELLGSAPQPRHDKGERAATLYNANRGGPPRTLLFCTTFATTLDDWNTRYRRWLAAVAGLKVHHDAVLLIDDGSPVLPDWPGLDIRNGGGTENLVAPPWQKPVMYHFPDHLGRRAVFDFEGWYRSFTFAGEIARARGFEKVVHLESDSFLISARIQRYIDNLAEGWTAFWCPRHGMPETAIQVIAGSAIARLAALPATHPHERLVGREFELQLPFDFVEKEFLGDRYGEYGPVVPGNADYAVQVRSDMPDSEYWWMRRGRNGK